MPGDFLTEDLTEFFDPDEFAHYATCKGETFPVMYLNEYEAAELFGLEIESSRPIAIAMDDNVDGIAHEDTLTIQLLNKDTVDYKIKEIQKGQRGLKILVLSKD